jgi:3-oxoacyl-[acyl-carrier protein] reductase
VFSGRTAPPALPGVEPELLARTHFVSADVSREDDVERLFDEAVRHLGGLDVIVNNAGKAHDRLLVETTLEEWNEVLGTNLRGPFLVMRRAVEELLAEGAGGSVVNVASIAAGGIVGQAAYAASKSALISMSRSVAKEYGHRGIRCNVVVPGFFDTEMTASLEPARRRHIEDLSPERRFGSVPELVEAILFLASAEASFITGDELWVSGTVRDIPRAHVRARS